MYEAALKRLSQKTEAREQTDDKFRHLGRTWGDDMKEVHNKNPTTFLLARKLIEEIIYKAHLNELSRATQIVNAEPVTVEESQVFSEYL